MASEVAWLVVVVGGAIAIILATALVDRMVGLAAPATLPRAVLWAAGVLVVLVALCLLLRVRAFADLDASFVAVLAESRSAGLVTVFSVVTTMGDVVPTLLIATSLAVVWHLSTRQVLRPLVLPAAVIVQVALQFAFGDVFRDPTIAEVRPDVVVGGSGPIPSGSMARLLAIFLVAAYLWAERDGRTASRLTAVAWVATLVELASRLYLGRHFVTDIVGGLLLGVLLSVAAAWLLSVLPGSPGRARAEPQRGRATDGQRHRRSHDPRP